MTTDTAIAEQAAPAQEPSETAEAKETVASEQAPKTDEMVPLKKLNRVRAALGEAERQRQAAIDRLAELEAKVKPVEKQRPVADDYATPDEYAEALAAHIVEERERKKADESKNPTPEQIAQNARSYEQKVQTFKAREAAHMKDNPGYEKAATIVNNMVAMMNTSHPAFKAFEDAVFSSEKAPQLIQHLGENPGEIARLARMGAAEVKIAIEDIIDGFGTPQTDGLDEETPEALPAPPKPITASAAKPKKTPDQMTGKELLKHMESLRRRGR